MLYFCPKAWTMYPRPVTYGLSERAKEFIYRIVLEMRVKENIEKLRTNGKEA